MELFYPKFKASLLIFFGIFFLTFYGHVTAQCNNGPFNGGFNAPNAPGVNTISSCSVRGTYHLIFSIQAGENYVFASSNNDDFLTISTGSDVPLAFGTSPLNWTATFSGNIKLHINANSSCGAGSGCRTTTIECTSCIPPPPGTCIHQSQWNASSAPNAQGQIESTDCFNTGFYWEYFDLAFGETYEFSTNQATDWITLTDEFNNVIVSGNVPVEWESTINGTVRVHLSADNNCNTDFDCHALYISCLTCPLPGPCIHPDFWSSSSAPTTPTPVESTNCMFTLYYWEYDNIQQGETYEFSTTITTDALVVTDEFDNVLATTNNGTVTWTATLSGKVRVHLSASEMCDFDFNCHPLYITCQSCSAPPPSPCVQQGENTTINAPMNPLPLQITGCMYAGEYNVINNIISGEEYIFSSSVATDLLTLTDANDNVLSFGIAPLTWTATISGTVRLHVSVDGSCATQNTCRSTFIEITSLPPGTCVHQMEFGSSNAPQSNAITTVTNCVNPGTYWQFNNIVSGETYVFNTNSPTDYITLTDGSNNVLTSGLVPLTWTASFSGSVRTHMSMNSSCFYGPICQVLLASCSTCTLPPAPCIQPTALHTANAPISQIPQQINSCSIAGIYNTINDLVSGETYTFTSSIATDYLTLTDENNNQLVFGTTPISWTASFSGTVRLHISQNGECAVQNTCRFASVQCNTCEPPCVFDSNAGSTELWYNCEVSNNTVYAGQYNTFSNVISGQSYTFSSSNLTDWLTLTDESNNILLVGANPLNWTSSFNGNVRLHVSSNTGCAVQIGVGIRALSGVCNTCSPAQVTCPIVTVTSPTSCSPEILAINWPQVEGAHEYMVFVGTSSGNYDLADGIIYDASTTGFDLQNPAPNQTYYFLVQALNCDGDVSSNCAEISFTTPEGCPCFGTPLNITKPANSTNCTAYRGFVGGGDAAVFTNISAGETYEIGSGNVDNYPNNDWLTITDNTNNVLVFGYQPLTWVASFSGTIRVHVATNHYCITGGFERVVELTCTSCPSPTTAPSCPSVTIAPEFSCSTPSFIASWTHVPNVAEYKINVATSPGNYYQVISVPPQYTGIELTNPIPDVTYYFLFETIDCEGNVSTGCQEVVITTPSACACIHPTMFASSDVPTNETPTIVSNCFTPGNFWEFTNVVQGRTYTLNTNYYVLSPDNGNEYFTLTDAQNNVLASGGIPFSWTATFSGTIRAHLSTTNGCGADNDCRDLIITCLDCNSVCNQPQLGTDIISSCSPITWIDGNTYSTSNNTATHLLSGAAQNGCDSLVTLNFTLWPCTQLQPSSCNATNVQMTDVLGAIAVPDHGGYRFRIVGANNGGSGWNGNTFILDRPVRNFRFSMVPGSIWGETYSVEVAVGDGLGNYGPYGNACDVTLASLPPTTQLQNSQCDINDVSQSTFLIANQVNNAAGYRFRIIGANNGAQGWSGNTFILDRATRNFKFNMVPGAIWGETYSVEVAVLSADNVTYGDYGTACNVTLQGTPTTALQSSQCGITNVAQNTALFANAVSGATGYRFKVVGANNGASGWTVDTYILDRPVRNFKLSMIPGVLQGEQYEVQVAVMDANGNYGAYGAVCTITLEGAPDLVINDDNILFNDKSLTELAFSASASHNPFTTDFGIQVLNANGVEPINVIIYDMSGKLIESNTVNPMDIESARFGQNLASGMYMVEVRQGTNQAMIRQVKN